jgi:hypothetical protein
MIPAVIKNLEQRLRLRQMRIGNVDGGEGLIGTAQWRPWQETGEGLHRLATALGGTSVVLQADVKSVQSGGSRPAAREPASNKVDARFITCRCQGGNKDCCFCGGRGFYAKPSAN